MKFLKIAVHLAVIYGFYLAGEWLVDVLGIPFPGSIIGFLLLFGALSLKLLPLRAVETGAQAMLAYLPLYFVPATVGIMNYFDLFAGRGAWLIVIVIVSTFVTLTVAGIASQWSASRFSKGGHSE